ncbi:hypothetical protein I302_100346 [Kwoniella bestiolae CBS 10118]|uniref:Uncharacterized protein n=1 Tax=Kwoniella bestiolae CBS 10118 TaxID=1296100 RepID=A0A1B9G4V6_9TREE|nr:hypothetical protein I302_03718 [Kwoniella bestiolae CBS 10118]OCF26041.1 hypothetical protein I302_03718 [Kwoniella bestiolae CBS 10118]
MMGSDIQDKVGSVLGLSNLTIKNPFINSGKGATPVEIRSASSKEPYDPCDPTNKRISVPVPDDRDFLVAIWDSLSPEEKMAQFAYGGYQPYFTSFSPSFIPSSNNVKGNASRSGEIGNQDISSSTTPPLTTGSSATSSTFTLHTPDTSPPTSPEPLAGPTQMNRLYGEDQLPQMILALTSDLGLTDDQKTQMERKVRDYFRRDELTLYMDGSGQRRGVRMEMQAGERQWAIWKEV